MQKAGVSPKKLKNFLSSYLSSGYDLNLLTSEVTGNFSEVKVQAWRETFLEQSRVGSEAMKTYLGL